MSFTDDLKKFSLNLGNVSEEVFRGTSIDVSTKVVVRTPVDSGRARGNWFATIDTPSDEVSDAKSKSGARPIGNAKTVANKIPLGRSFVLTNNLPYIERLEDGYSGQAPEGMVEKTVNEFQRVVDAQANNNRR